LGKNGDIMRIEDANTVRRVTIESLSQKGVAVAAEDDARLHISKLQLIDFKALNNDQIFSTD